MNLRTGTIVLVLVAAGGTTALRALWPAARSPALEVGSPHPSAAELPEIDPTRRPGRRRAPLTEREAVVYVAGEVLRPGVYRVAADARAVDAVHLAGGPTRLADLVGVNLAAPAEDGSEIVVPAKGSLEGGVPGTAGTRARRTRGVGQKHRAAHQRRKRSAAPDTGDVTQAAPITLDVNRADAAALETLPGVGPALAERIVRFRELNGSYAASDELLDVAGMTPNKVDALAPYLTFR